MKDLANFLGSDSDTVCWPLSFTPPLMIPLTHSFLKNVKKASFVFSEQTHCKTDKYILTSPISFIWFTSTVIQLLEFSQTLRVVLSHQKLVELRKIFLEPSVTLASGT